MAFPSFSDQFFRIFEAPTKVDDSSESEEDSDSTERGFVEAKSERDSRVHAKRRVSPFHFPVKTTIQMVRIAVLSITFVVMCWIILSYRE